MGKNEAAKSRLPKSCRECERWSEVRERVRLLEVLEAAIEKVQKALTGPDFKPSLGDYVKLVQMEKELDEAASDAKEIRVTWVEPTDSQNEE